MDDAERFNTTSHLVGVILAMAGVAVLMVKVAAAGDPLRIVSFSIYGATLFLLYLASTLYHRASERHKPLLRILDHQSVYLLIAGTYTPFSLVTLHGRVGWWLFGATWGIALAGIILERVPYRGKQVIPVMVYLVMGWLGLFALEPLLNTLPVQGFGWLLAGGVLYSVGVIFFILARWYPWSHGVWHLFVLAGSASHYFAILLYV